MSYDYGVEIDTGGSEAFSLTDHNITCNLHGMFRLAIHPNREFARDEPTGLPGLHGVGCPVAADLLDAAVKRMYADPAAFKAHNPENGWGDYDGALEALEGLRDDCRRHPFGRVYVHA